MRILTSHAAHVLNHTRVLLYCSHYNPQITYYVPFLSTNGAPHPPPHAVYTLFDWLTRQTARLWRGGVPELLVLSECSPHPPCDPAQCAHGPRTRTCALVVELPPPEPGGLDVTCTSNQRREECVCEARNATAVEQLKVPCTFQLAQGADGMAAHAFRNLKWPENCPVHQEPP